MNKTKPDLELSGADGNAFMLLALASRAAKRAGWERARIDGMMKDAKAGDYDHLLAVLDQHFEIS